MNNKAPGATFRRLVLLLCALALTSHVPAQSAGTPNEGSQFTYDSYYDFYTVAWWGLTGRTYFIQQSDDLMDWNYVPVIESGWNDIVAWNFTSSADKFFVRLRYSDIPTNDPFNADFDGDKISNYSELWNGTDPLKCADTDNDGIPDDWEIYYGLNPNDPNDAGANSDDDGLSDLEEFQNGTNPWSDDSDYDGVSDR